MTLPTPYYDRDGITIYHADCREILPLLEPGNVDLVLTDPPYGFGRFATDGHDFMAVVGPALKSTFCLLRSPGSMFVFMSTGEVVRLANEVGAEHFYRLLWMYKPADMTYPLGGWLLTSEAILWFQKGETLSNLQERHPYRHDTYIHKRVGMEGVNGHPTVKPVDVCRDFVSRCIQDGIILDPFMGSGTTLRAAKDLGRRAIGIEIEEKYCEIAVERLRQEVLPL